MNLKNFVKENRKIYLLLIFILIIGIVKGNFDLISIKKNIMSELGDYINNFFSVIHSGQIKKEQIILEEFLNSIKLFLVVWLCGSSIIGIPVIFYIVYLKGYIVGFCSGILIKSMGLNGINIIIANILPKEIFIIPIIVILSVSGIKFSIGIIKNSRLRLLKQKNIVKEFGKYSLLGVILSFISFVVILVNWEISFKFLVRYFP